MSPSISLGPTLALLIGAMTPALAQDDDLGRLFNTPQQRAELDRGSASRSHAGASAFSTELRLDGVVLRSDGQNTVWLNRRPLSASAARLHIDADSVAVPSGAGRRTRLRVGDTLRLPAGDGDTP